MADILDSVRGLYTTYDRNYSYIGARGFNIPGDYNSRVLVLVDGHRINDSLYDSVDIGTQFPIDVDLIDRVEIVRGPTSSLYGNNAFFGVIHVITKRGRDLKGTEISGEVASFETYKSRLSYGNTFQNGLELLVSGSIYDSQGKEHLFYKEFDDPATNNGIAENADGDQYYSLLANLLFRDFSLRGAYEYREKDIPTASFGALFNDPGSHTIDKVGYVDLQYEHSFADQLGVMARLYYDRYYFDAELVHDNPPITVNKDKGPSGG